MFAVPFAEIGPIVGRSPDAAEILASRARRKVQGSRVTGEGRARQREVVDAVERGLRAAGAVRRVLVNGEPGILTWSRAGKPLGLMACTVSGGRITEVVAVLDPTRLATMDCPALTVTEWVPRSAWAVAKRPSRRARQVSERPAQLRDGGPRPATTSTPSSRFITASSSSARARAPRRSAPVAVLPRRQG